MQTVAGVCRPETAAKFSKKSPYIIYIMYLNSYSSP